MGKLSWPEKKECDRRKGSGGGGREEKRREERYIWFMVMSVAFSMESFNLWFR